MATLDLNVASAAEAVRRLLDLIEIGDVDASPEERFRLEGAVAALLSLLDEGDPKSTTR